MNLKHRSMFNHQSADFAAYQSIQSTQSTRKDTTLRPSKGAPEPVSCPLKHP